MVTFEAPKPMQYLSFPKNGGGIELTILEEEAEPHADFKCKGEPAKIYVVMDHDDNEKKRFTVTSSQLRDTLDQVAAHFGSFLNVRMEIIAKGTEKKRTYAVEISDKVAEQMKIGA